MALLNLVCKPWFAAGFRFTDQVEFPFSPLWINESTMAFFFSTCPPSPRAKLNERTKVPKQKALSFCRTKRVSFLKLCDYFGTMASLNLVSKPGFARSRGTGTVLIRQHTSAYVSIRQHTSAFDTIDS
jgi:hypothetical protein